MADPLSKFYIMNIGILGATGLVGQTFLNLLETSSLNFNNLQLFASEKSEGQKIVHQGASLTIELISEDHLKNLDLLFVATGDQWSLEWSPKAIEQGCYVIDNSSAFRRNPNCALVIPEVNPEKIIKNHPQILANPNCSTIQLTLPLKALAQNYKITDIKVASYQAVSGAGKAAQEELLRQSQSPPHAPVSPQALSHPIAYNCIPQIGQILDDGFCAEEDKIMEETCKILNLPDLNISAFTVRIPSFNGHAQVLWVKLDQEISKSQMIQSLHCVDNIVVSENSFHTVREVSGQKKVYVGRIHRDRKDPQTWVMWIVADNLLKGAAWNALQIAEKLFC